MIRRLFDDVWRSHVREAWQLCVEHFPTCGERCHYSGPIIVAIVPSRGAIFVSHVTAIDRGDGRLEVIGLAVPVHLHATPTDAMLDRIAEQLAIGRRAVQAAEPGIDIRFFGNDFRRAEEVDERIEVNWGAPLQEYDA